LQNSGSSPGSPSWRIALVVARSLAKGMRQCRREMRTPWDRVRLSHFRPH
jgi:hypothetical protein